MTLQIVKTAFLSNHSYPVGEVSL